MAQQIKRERTSCLSEKERRCHSVLETHVFSMSSAECYGTLFPTYSTTSCPLCIPLVTEEWTAVLFTQWSFTYDEVFTPAVFLCRYAHIAKLNTHTHTHKCCFDVQNEMRKRRMSEESSVYTTYSRSKWHTQQQFPLLCAGINYIWLLEFTLESAGSYCILAESHCWWRSSELVLASHNVASEWEAKLQSARLKLIIFVLGFLCGVLGHLHNHSFLKLCLFCVLVTLCVYNCVCNLRVGVFTVCSLDGVWYCFFSWCE